MDHNCNIHVTRSSVADFLEVEGGDILYVL